MRKRSPGSPSQKTRSPVKNRSDRIPKIPSHHKIRGDPSAVFADAEAVDQAQGGRVETGVSQRCDDRKEHDQVVVLCNAHESDKYCTHQKTDADVYRETFCVREPSDKRLGEGRGDVVCGHEQPGRKVGVAVVYDEQRENGRQYRHVNIGDKVCRGKSRYGIFYGTRVDCCFRFRRRISTPISCTSCVWKEKVRLMGNIPPIFSSISARSAV